MPAYKFQWSSVPVSVLDALRQHLGLDGDSAEVLRQEYGARPKENFIKDTWPALIDIWLSHYSDRTHRLASLLRERGLGDTEIVEDLAYLKTCRNTAHLRSDAVQEFIEFGEQGEETVESQPDHIKVEAAPTTTTKATQQLSSSIERDSELRDEILALWESLKPRDAHSLITICMDNLSRFAGQYSSNADQHGDRYFVIKQSPRTGQWTMRTNLVSILNEKSAELPKKALEGIGEYRDVLANSIYKLVV